MKCSELRSNLPLYGDDDAGNEVMEHLAVCPLCRQKNIEFREIRADLTRMRRAEMPAGLADSIKRNVTAEIANQRPSLISVGPDLREWLQMRVMPYGVGVFASVLIGVTLLSMLFSGIGNTGQFDLAAKQTTAGDPSVLLASNTNPFTENPTDNISAAAFASSRPGLGNDSPSINPQGALIALTRSLIRGGMKDDEVVVVADVFGNGLAQIAEVVEPSRDRMAVVELERALQSDPAYAPFVPSGMENRRESVRVILKFQSVDVSTNLGRDRRRR